MEHHYRWRDVAQPDLLNDVWVEWTADGIGAHGVQKCPVYQAVWRLDATHGWITRSLEVEVSGSTGWSRSLVLHRGDGGTWTDTVTTHGTPPGDMPAPGIVHADSLAAALDCDLARCPLTNTMPIRRLGLRDGEVPRTPLVMAWIDLPSLQVIASDQYYSSHDTSHVRYESGTRGVDVLLEVDADGVVIDYPDLARRL